MLIIGYCMGIRSERRLCDEVHLNLAYRWFCRLGLNGQVPDHSTFSRNRHGRFRESNILRRLFESVVELCLREGLIGGDGFAVDASLIAADANKYRSLPSSEWNAADIGPDACRAAREYLASHVSEFSRPIMRGAAGLHAYGASFHLREEFEHFRSRQFSPQSFPALIDHRMNLKRVLCEIDADSNVLLHERSPSCGAPSGKVVEL